jgi:hypothetical protein
MIIHPQAHGNLRSLLGHDNLLIFLSTVRLRSMVARN